jgi:hypothetical protein
MNLPDDCWNIIFHRCNINDTFRLASVNKYFDNYSREYYCNLIKTIHESGHGALIDYYKTDKKTIKIYSNKIKTLTTIHAYTKNNFKLYCIGFSHHLMIDVHSFDIGHELPNALFRAKHLVILNITSTKITKIPHQISLLRNLTSVDFCKNNISIVSNQLFKLPRLTKIYLADNPLELTSDLQYYISQNRVSDIKPNTDMTINIFNSLGTKIMTKLKSESFNDILRIPNPLVLMNYKYLMDSCILQFYRPIVVHKDDKIIDNIIGTKVKIHKMHVLEKILYCALVFLSCYRFRHIILSILNNYEYGFFSSSTLIYPFGFNIHLPFNIAIPFGILKFIVESFLSNIIFAGIMSVRKYIIKKLI